MKLTKAQAHMLSDCLASDAAGGITIFDGVMAGVATRLHEKGLVTLPAGHGFLFYSNLHRVRITPAGRAALKGSQSK